MRKKAARMKLICALTAMASVFFIGMLPADVSALGNIVTGAFMQTGQTVTHDHTAMTAWTGTTNLPSSSGTYYLTHDVTISSTWNVPSGTVDLCLNGHGIIRTGASGTTGSVIQVGGGAKLNLYDCSSELRYYTVANPTANGAGLGTVVDKSAYDAASENARGTFTGGYITGGVISGNADAQHLIGGGVNVAGGSFTMYGGTIIGNKVCINGGAVKVKGAGASFVMNGGALLANYNDCYGGAISVGDNSSSRLCTLTINGGTIARNWSGRNGGAIHFDGYNHNFTITGGSIVNNYTNGNYDNGNVGRAGGGVLKSGATLVMSGNPVIKDNMNGGNQPNDIYLLSSTTDIITLSGLTEGADLYIAYKDLNASADIKIATGAQKEDIRYIRYDLPDEGCVIFCDGAKDWCCLDGEIAAFNGAQHTHAAGTLWATVSPVAAVTDGSTATVYTGFSAALNAWTSGSTLKLLSDVATSSTITVPSGEHTLDLNGHGIKMTGSGAVIKVPSGADLTVTDSKSTEKTHYYYINSSTNLAVIVSTKEAAQNGNAGKNGSFTGGYITGGQNPSGRDEGGGGIDVVGKLTMSGGTVIGNYVAGAGGGICVTGAGIAELTGTNILGNKTGNVGGGVDVNGRDIKLVMTDCLVRHNRAESNTAGVAARGGAVSLKNCEVSYNNAKTNTSGIVAQHSHVTVEDISVIGNTTDNSSNQFSPGITVRNHTSYNSFSFTVKGTVTLENNKMAGNADDSVYIHDGRNISIGGELTNTVPIKIVLQNGTGVFTSGWKDKMRDADPSKYFRSDNGNYKVFLNNGGEAQIGIPPVASVISGETTTDYSSISDAVSSTNWTAGSTLKLMSDVTTSSTITVPSGEHTLDLNGHGIKKTGTGCVIKVNEQSTLNLKDSDTAKEHKYKIANPAGNGAGVATVDDTLTSGYQTFTGGYITGGYITGGYNYGAGINVEGNGAALNMYGGTIIGNRLTAGYTGGGGVCLQDWDRSGGFNMYGGLIIGNTSNYGGGVYVRCGTMVMHDGEISNNVAKNNIGGALLAYGSSSTFILEGGVINGNYAQHGGAIEASGEATVSIFGGTITNNTATGKGGALTNQRSDGDSSPAVFNISGAPVFSGNTAGGKSSDVYLCNTAVLNLTEALTNTMPFGVSRSSTTGAFTSGWKDAMGDANPADYFASDSDDYIVIRNDSGEAEIRVKPVARVSVGDTVNEYVAISDAVNAWKNGGTLTLLEDVSYNSLINMRPMYGYNAGEYTLDLNGKTLNIQSIQVGLNNSPNTLRTGPHLIITDSKTGGMLRFAESGMIDYGGLVELRGGTLTGGNGTWGGLFLLHIYASLDMYDGVTLTGNTATYGGAVLVGSDSEFNMYGGKISGNSASDSGGGVVIFDNEAARFNMYGGEISGNRAPKGGGVAVTVGQFHLCGEEAIIQNNVSGGSWNSETGAYTGGTANNLYLANGKKITIAGNLPTTPVGITLQNGAGAFTSGWSGAMGAADPTDYFTADNSDYEIRTLNGEAYVGPPHTHNWVYAADGNVITVTCSGVAEGICDVEPQTLTISATGKIYDGTPVTAFLTYSDDWTTHGFTIPEIAYTGNTDAGTYTASVTLGGKTAAVMFTIEEKSMAAEVSGVGFTGNYDGKVHGSTVNAPDGATIRYGTEEGQYTLDATPAYTDAGNYTVYYRVTKKNYITVTGSVTVTINSINATVIIIGNHDTVDYDGEEHTVTGYTAVADTLLYDVTKDFTFSGNEQAKAANAGTMNMGLAADQFANTNPNFSTVTFIVADGYITINSINATVIITGNHDTVDYDGEEHTVTGYTAVADTLLYDVTKDFTFSGNEQAKAANAGTMNMGLAADQFANTNPNFSTVTFIVADGYLTVVPVDAVITAAPVTANPIYSGSQQPLVFAGEVTGGTLYYALGVDPKNPPDDDLYHTAIPSAKEIGSYYVWYKVVADSNHNDLSSACVKVVLAEESWVTLEGTLYDSDGKTPLSDAVVTLAKGSQTVDYEITDAQGNYRFITPTGVYSMIAESQEVTSTTLVKAFADKRQNFVMSGGKTESQIQVLDGLGIAVGGLNDEAYAIREADHVADDQSVAVLMTVEAKTKRTAAYADSILALTPNKSLEFFEIKVEKTVNTVTTLLSKTASVLEIAVPYAKTAKRGLCVFASDEKDVQALVESDSQEEGTFRVDKENGVIYIYSSRCSTFAMGYTPYYRVDHEVSLGSFEGTATVVVTSLDGEEVFQLENVALGDIRFADIPKGRYTMTITWEDGVLNTLTMPLTIGAEDDESEDVSDSASTSVSTVAMERNGAALSAAIAPIPANRQIRPVILTAAGEGRDVAEGLVGDPVSAVAQSAPDRPTLYPPRQKRVYLRV